jgi:uncharacterized protein YcfJ
MNTLILAALAGLSQPATPVSTVAPWAPEISENSSRRDRVYDSRGRYYEPRRLSRNDRVWRGNNGQYYCKRDNGTTGLVIGAAAGGLLGHEIAGRGDKTLGAIIGAVGGGVLGRSIDRGDVKCR